MATEKYRITFEIESFEGVPKDTIAFGIEYLMRGGKQLNPDMEISVPDRDKILVESVKNPDHYRPFRLYVSSFKENPLVVGSMNFPALPSCKTDTFHDLLEDICDAVNHNKSVVVMYEPIGYKEGIRDRTMVYSHLCGDTKGSDWTEWQNDEFFEEHPKLK